MVLNTALVLEMNGGRNLLIITGEATKVDIRETTFCVRNGSKSYKVIVFFECVLDKPHSKGTIARL